MRRTLLIPLLFIAFGCSSGSNGNGAASSAVAGANSAVAAVSSAVSSAASSTASAVSSAVNALTLQPAPTPDERRAASVAQMKANVAATRAQIQQQMAQRPRTSPF